MVPIWQTLLSAVLLPAVAVCGPVAAPYASDFGYTFNPLAAATVAAPAPSSQYHAQVQGSAKRWALGCVNLRPVARGSQEAGFTQPRAHLIASPSLYLKANQSKKYP